MARTAKSPVYVSGQVRDKIAELAALTSALVGRKVTYGEAVERAVDAALKVQWVEAGQ